MLDTFGNPTSDMDNSGLSRSDSVRHPNTPQHEDLQARTAHTASPGARAEQTQEELVDALYEEFEEFMPFGSLPVLTKSGPTCTLTEYRQGLTVARMCQSLREVPSQRHGIPNVPSTPPPPPYVEDVLDDPRAKKFGPRGPAVAAKIGRGEQATTSNDSSGSNSSRTYTEVRRTAVPAPASFASRTYSDPARPTFSMSTSARQGSPLPRPSTPIFISRRCTPTLSSRPATPMRAVH